MHSQMSAEFVRSGEPFGAVWPCANVRLLSGVCAHVRFEVIGSGEFSLADFALEWANAGVFAAVSSELVRS